MHKTAKALRLAIALGIPAVAVAQPGFKYWNPRDSLHVVPPTLSATGLYTDIVSVKKRLLANAYLYEVNSPLWSDGSKKKRWVMLKPGSAPIAFEEKNDYWGYPDSTVFVKQFAIDTIQGDSTSRVLWETRLLMLKKGPLTPAGKPEENWYGYTYKWNADQKDAVLIPSAGKDDTIRVYPQGKSMPSVMKKWRFPSRLECISCHRIGEKNNLQGRAVLGFFTAQINRQHPDTNANQIAYLFKKNVLGGVQPANYALSPRWYPIEDSTATVDQRARAYLAANCSGCHGTRGVAHHIALGIPINFDFHTMVPAREIRHDVVLQSYDLQWDPPFYYPKVDGNNPSGLDSLDIMPALLVPGFPTKSVLLFRQNQRNTTPGDFGPAEYQMPPYAVYEKNQPALDLMTKWITDMERMAAPNSGVSIHRTGAARMNLKGPAFQGRQIVLPAELAEIGGAGVSMMSITGRSVELTRTSRTTYAIPASTPHGLYIIKVGDRSFTRNLL